MKQKELLYCIYQLPCVNIHIIIVYISKYIQRIFVNNGNTMDQLTTSDECNLIIKIRSAD